MPTEPTATRSTLVSEIRRVIAEDFGALNLSVRLNRSLTRIVPDNAGFRLRTMLLRAGGWNIDRATIFASVPVWSGSGPIRTRLSVGAGCWINVGCHFDLSDDITIGDHVAIGHDVLIMTATHQLGSGRRRAAGLTTGPVTIGSGAWIGARSTLLPGVTVGKGAIVSAGAVVNSDVPDNTVAAGVPAKVVVPRLPR